jgi:NAD(P)H-dependent FMN reductase
MTNPIPSQPLNVLVFAASLRKDSLNQKLAALAARVARDFGAHVDFASMPGAVKNLIDWTSRFRPQPFDSKHGLLMSASPSLGGGNRGLWSLRTPLEHLGSRIFPDMFSLAMAHKAFEGDRIADATLYMRFEKNVQAFLSLAEAATHYPCMKRAWVEFLGEPPGAGADRVDPVPV